MLFRKIYLKFKSRKYNNIQKKLKLEYPTCDIGSYASIKNAKFEGANVIQNEVDVSNSHIGYGTVIGSKTKLTNSLIGRFCSIACNVHVVTATHPLNFVSTYPGFYNTRNNYPFGKGSVEIEEFIKTSRGYSVEIGNDVWIGEGVTIKGGIKIGDGAVIGMNATLTKDVPPYAIVGGIPAKIIKYRLSDEQIKKLLQIKWWNWSPNIISKRKEDFINIDEFIKKYY